MEYILGAVVGLLFGAAVAFLKGRLLWSRLMREDASQTALSGVMLGQMISFAVNVATLAIVFLLRDRLPFSWIACIVATAFALSTLNAVFAARVKKEISPSATAEGQGKHHD